MRTACERFANAHLHRGAVNHGSGHGTGEARLSPASRRSPRNTRGMAAQLGRKHDQHHQMRRASNPMAVRSSLGWVAAIPLTLAICVPAASASTSHNNSAPPNAATATPDARFCSNNSDLCTPPTPDHKRVRRVLRQQLRPVHRHGPRRPTAGTRGLHLHAVQRTQSLPCRRRNHGRPALPLAQLAPAAIDAPRLSAWRAVTVRGKGGRVRHPIRHRRYGS